MSSGVVSANAFSAKLPSDWTSGAIRLMRSMPATMLPHWSEPPTWMLQPFCVCRCRKSYACMSWYVNSVKEMPCCEFRRVWTLRGWIGRWDLRWHDVDVPFSGKHGAYACINPDCAQELQEADALKPIQVVHDRWRGNIFCGGSDAFLCVRDSTLEELVDTGDEAVNVGRNDFRLGKRPFRVTSRGVADEARGTAYLRTVNKPGN